MCRYPPIQITNVVGFMRFPTLLDFYATVKKNPTLTYEPEVSQRYVSLPTNGESGRVLALRAGLEVLGAKSEQQAKRMLNKAYKEHKWVFETTHKKLKYYVKDKRGNYMSTPISTERLKIYDLIKESEGISVYQITKKLKKSLVGADMHKTSSVYPHIRQLSETNRIKIAYKKGRTYYWEAVIKE